MENNRKNIVALLDEMAKVSFSCAQSEYAAKGKTNYYSLEMASVEAYDEIAKMLTDKEYFNSIYTVFFPKNN